jgi:LemA protein
MNSIESEVKQLYDNGPGGETAGKPRWVSIVKISLFAGVPALLAAFYIGGAIYWWNTDILELNLIYAQEIQLEKECKRRDDLIPNLVTIAKKYASHERVLFQYVSDARSQLEPAAGTREGSPVVNKAELLSKLIALSEQYPDLKATKSFQELMDMMETTEDRIATMRDNYITATLDYNICNQRFWCNFFTYIVNFFAPLPAFVDYYYTNTENKYPPLLKEAEELTGKGKMEEQK